MRPTKLLLRSAAGDDANIRFTDLTRLIEACGFELVRVSGSHHIFFARPKTPSLLNLQQVGAPRRGDAQVRGWCGVTVSGRVGREGGSKGDPVRVTFVGGPLNGQTMQQRGRGPIFRDDEGKTVPVARGQRAWLHGRFVAGNQAQVYMRQDGLGDAGIVYVHATAWEDWHHQHRIGASAEAGADFDVARRLRDLARRVEGGSELFEIVRELEEVAAELEDRREGRRGRA